MWCTLFLVILRILKDIPKKVEYHHKQKHCGIQSNFLPSKQTLAVRLHFNWNCCSSYFICVILSIRDTSLKNDSSSCDLLVNMCYPLYSDVAIVFWVIVQCCLIYSWIQNLSLVLPSLFEVELFLSNIHAPFPCLNRASVVADGALQWCGCGRGIVLRCWVLHDAFIS